ncbi:MAG: TetR/AcrR family transcriptional regulator [Bacteroidota bacterium]
MKAAAKVFLAEGYAGARMQQIADEANINKAMLHYYFKSKEKLMQQVFTNKFMTFFPRVQKAFQSGADFEEILSTIIDGYLDLLEENPRLPLFILDTMHRNPEFIKFLPDLPGDMLIKGIEGLIERGEIRPIKAHHLLLNILSLCIFPFLVRPMFKKVFSVDDAFYEQIIKERKAEVFDFVKKSIQNEG